jgi:methylglutaconyl-CoA hydratase
MIEHKTLKVTKDKYGVVSLNLNRPEVHNAFDAEMVVELRETARQLGEDSEVRAVILRGEGQSFCAGADLKWMQEAANYTPEKNRADSSSLSAMLYILNALPKPLIALVHGAAFGGGAGLVAVADIAIGLTDSKFAFSEVQLGLTPATVSPYVVAAIGARNARAYFLSGKRFDGREAFRIGLLHQLAESQDEMEDMAAVWIQSILESAPGAVTAAKILIASLNNREITPALREKTAELIAAERASIEGREGTSAFLEKRRPGWYPKDD